MDYVEYIRKSQLIKERTDNPVDLTPMHTKANNFIAETNFIKFLPQFCF
jgi:hypothetical protein